MITSENKKAHRIKSDALFTSLSEAEFCGYRMKVPRDWDAYLKNEPYVVEGVWQRIEVEKMNVVLLNGEKVH